MVALEMSRSRPEVKSNLREKNKVGRGQADEERFREQVEVKKVGDGCPRQWHNDVTADRSARSLQRRCDGPLCFWRT